MSHFDATRPREGLREAVSHTEKASPRLCTHWAANYSCVPCPDCLSAARVRPPRNGGAV